MTRRQPPVDPKVRYFDHRELLFVFVFNLFIFGWAGSSLRCTGFSLWWLLLLRSTGSRCEASVVVARGLSSCGSRALERRSVVVMHRLSCSTVCGIFPDRGLNLFPLQWQADS